MVPKNFYEDYPFKTRDKGVILGSLIKKGKALNKKFLDSQFVNLLFSICRPGVVLNIIPHDAGLNGVVESRMI